MKLKPCPFCGAQLEKRHNHYIAIDGTTVDYDFYEHPYNGCVLEDRLCEQGCLFENDIKKWNERVRL